MWSIQRCHLGIIRSISKKDFNFELKNNETKLFVSFLEGFPIDLMILSHMMLSRMLGVVLTQPIFRMMIFHPTQRMLQMLLLTDLEVV